MRSRPASYDNAVHHLEEFAHHVDSLASAGHLSAGDAESVRSAARRVMDALGFVATL